MRLKTIIQATFLFVAGIATTSRAQELVTYPAPQGVEMKQDFSVKVRLTGGEWKDVDTYAVKVDEVKNAKHNVRKASLAYFDFNGEVEVEVTANETIETARVRPLSYEIVPQVEGCTLRFKLDRPRNLSVEVNGKIFSNLHLFYIAGGAVVRGCVRAIGVHDVKILGRGIVHPEGRGAGVTITRSRNVEVKGVITTQCPTGESDSVYIHNVKAISSYGWGDGMNVFASNNVLFDGVFCRNSDDCTTVYATRLGHSGGCRNITMQNSTLWADVAHPIFIGLHGDPGKFEIMENLTYRNIDILDHSEMQVDYQGCMAINAGDNNLVRNVRFEDIRVEDFRRGQLVNIRIFYNKKYCKAPGRGIEDVLFKNITYNGHNAELSHIIGYDRDRMVRNIRFENLRINGTVISDDMPGKPAWYKTGDMARFFIGEHVEDVTFSK